MRATDIAGKMKTIAQNYKTSYIWAFLTVQKIA